MTSRSLLARAVADRVVKAIEISACLTLTAIVVFRMVCFSSVVVLL
jgi:hypothetical protein